MKRLIPLLSVLLICSTSASGQEADDLHKPTLIKMPAAMITSQKKIPEAAAVLPQNVSAESAAVWQFLARHAKDYRLSDDASNIQLVAEKESLLGKHYYFQQLLGGVEVDRATLVVTTNPDGQVTRVYTSMIPVTENVIARATKANKSVDEALDTAWKTLGAQPEQKKGLYSDPKTTLTYLPTKTGFQLTYAVDLHVDRKTVAVNGKAGTKEPGLWRVYVDAVTGAPVAEPVKLSTDNKDQEVEYEKQAGDRSAAFQQYFKFKATENDKTTAAAAASETAETGSALVFDPDPLTALKDLTLTDTSDAAKFDLAYKQVPTLEITKRGGKFFLEGPWVVIDDFETPNTAPSSTTDGKWTFKRGNNGFNDVMTYFHIDRSQRYIQSLGFTNIQHGPIRCDADGLDGEDNSHFVPSTNTLAFGHGCIDDNEDADVILHEYGHAITHSINPQWFGGDTGAIGEAFGDYWAETSSIATVGGEDSKPNRTFDWDSSSGCWAGRRLNVKPTEVTYIHTKIYGAHQSIGGGVQSDELWGTPLYQAHLALRAKGVPREEIDKIVLQSMFGLGSGFKMRQLAENVVETAKTLFPMGEHAAEFEKQFKALKILP